MSEETSGPRFNHERLDVYVLAVDVAQWAQTVTIPPARKHLREQLLRAVDSVVLNIADGSGYDRGDSRRDHYRIALGSAAEVCAVLDLLAPPGRTERQHQLRRIGAMLASMTR